MANPKSKVAALQANMREITSSVQAGNSDFDSLMDWHNVSSGNEKRKVLAVRTEAASAMHKSYQRGGAPAMEVTYAMTKLAVVAAHEDVLGNKDRNAARRQAQIAGRTAAPASVTITAVN